MGTIVPLKNVSVEDNNKNKSIYIKQLTNEENAYLKHQQEQFDAKEPHALKASIASILKAEESGCLFHGTPNKEPFQKLKPHKTELDAKPVVFAGVPWMGVSSLGRWNDSEIQQWTKDGQPYMRPVKGELRDYYKAGGCLHIVSPVSFTSTTQVSHTEFVSYEAVEVLDSVFISDPVKFLKLLGVVLLKHAVPVYLKW